MILSFRHKGLMRLYRDDDASKLPCVMVERISVILAALDSAITIEALNRPSFRLHELKGDRKGEWAIVVRANWRITCQFADGDATDVSFEDYH
jgi:proteic killer suppression protein